MSDSLTSRRAFVLASLAGATALVTGGARLPAQVRGKPGKSLPEGIPREITVYKDANCGCCTEWVKHMESAGFVATVRNTGDMQTVKASMGVPSALASCHTARVGTYVVEGHVPSDLVVRLLTEKPDARGLAVPGMPAGSPGMEGPYKEKYDILLFDRSGKSRVYASR